MKKSLKAISTMLSAALVLSMAATVTVTAFAEDGDNFEKKELTAYLYNMEDTTSIECLFTAALPDIPYIDAADYVANVFDTKFTETKNSDGTFTLSHEQGSMTINTENDTICFDSFEDFMNIAGKSEGTMLDAKYTRASGVTLEGENKSITFDLGKYDLDIISYDDKVYFPLPTISDLLFISYNGAMYVDGSIYFFHSMNEVTTPYIDTSSLYESTQRSPELIDYTYNELCFVIDTCYGAPAKSKIGSLVQEKGLDKALDEYGDDTRTAKELLKSDDIINFIFGLCWLDDAFNDGGHTVLYASIAPPMNAYKDSPVGQELLDRIKDPSNIDAQVAVKTALGPSIKSMNNQKVKDLRAEQYSKYELVKSWEGPAASKLYVNGDTALFVFDSFQNDAVDGFKWSLDYAAEHNLKKFVIDISCNSGGSTAVVMYMMGIMTNVRDHSNKEFLRCLNTVTGVAARTNYELDLNLDGEFDELDNEVIYDFEYAIITSHISFSCGNLLPVMSQDNGIPIFGQTSGGGSCMLSVFKTPEERIFTLSGFKKFINKDDVDADIGAPVNYDLTKTVIADDGTEEIDYSGLYDIENISKLMDEFYGNKEESSQEESSKEEPSKEEPSKEEPSQSEPSQSEPSKSQSSQSQPSQSQSSQSQPIVTPGTKNFDTGDSSSAWIIVFVMLGAAGMTIAVCRRNKAE